MDKYRPRGIMKTTLGLVLVLIIGLLSCNEKHTEQKNNKKQEDSTWSQPNSSESLSMNASIEANGLKILKSVFDSQNEIGLNKSIKIYDKDSITDIIYLRNLFPIWESDSIEFYGNIERSDIDFNNFPVNSLLIIHLNNRRLARNQINLLQFERQNKKQALERVFGPGGIAFELNNQLCIYSVDACKNDYNTIERIDSIIKSELQYSYNYERILTTCKPEPFERRVD